jgi:indolepyruvate ferredoxin oxidoreductase beta subunit
MEPVNFIVCGLGGQGILFLTKILAQTALDQGLDALGAETHGMAQRGGSVISHLRLGAVKSSLVRTGTAHFILALEAHEAYRNLSFLAPGGIIYANAGTSGFPRPEVAAYLDKHKMACRHMPAGKAALELGSPRSANLALIGFFSAFDDSPLTAQALRQTVAHISPAQFVAANLSIFDTCRKWGQNLNR